MLTDPTPNPPLGASRTAVLRSLRAMEHPASAADMAARTGLHINTARFHLDRLVQAGLAKRGNADAGRPGRPRTVYQATTADPAIGQRSYRLLAEMLTGLISSATPEPQLAAVQAGRAWGRYLVDRPAPGETVNAGNAVNRVTRMLTNAGFGLDPVTEPDNPVLALRHCPFREIAEQHRDVVCALHLGMLQGALEEIHAPLTTNSLEPFVEPSLCVAHLHRTDTARGGSSAAGQPRSALVIRFMPESSPHRPQ